MTPQPYNRMYQLTGTEGFANKYPVEGFAVSAQKMEAGGVKPSADNLSGHSYLSEKDKKALEETYLSPIIKRYGEEAKEVGGHGGMDFIMDSRLVYCYKMVFLWTSTYMIWQNGAVLASLEQSL